jgi:serine/threonine protein kinase/WD40 repeat protein
MDSSSDVRDPVEILADEFTARKRRGERPTLDEYCARHPELADAIRDLFPALVMVEDLAGSSVGATGEHQAAPVDLKQIADYRILREVGRGGMGVVYEAEQESLGRRVALKVLPPHALLDAKHVARFEREAKAAARLHHTNIVPVFGVGTHDSTHFYVMQFIQGQGLDDVIEELGRLKNSKPGGLTTGVHDRSKDLSHVAQSMRTGSFAPAPPDSGDGAAAVPVTQAPASPSSASSRPISDSSIRLPEGSEISTLSGSDQQLYRSVARIGAQVAQALDYAHSQGILHRDIKPSNLLLDLKGIVWVTDFGLAKAGDAGDLTHTGDIVGTVRYMAPERFQGKSDARSDVYALGLTLYELLALRPAFNERDRLKLIQHVTHEDAPRLRKINPRVPRDLETIVHKAMAREPERRYQSAKALTDDLQRFVEDRPIHARRVTVRERFWRWCRRNPALAATAAALILAVLVGNGLVIWKWQEAERAEEQQAEATRLATGAAERERAEKKNADAARRRAEVLLAEQFVQRGGQLQEKGDVSAAALCFVEALRQDHEESERTDMHRIRIAAALRQAPAPRYLILQASPISCFDFSPDGKQIVTGTEDGTVQRWNAATGAALGAAIKHANRITKVAYSADGGRIIVLPFLDIGALRADPAKSATLLWHPATGNVDKLPTVRGALVTMSVANSVPQPHPTWICTLPKANVAHVWNACTGERVGAPIECADPISAMGLSPDGRKLWTVNRKGGLQPDPDGFPSVRYEGLLWDVTTGTKTPFAGAGTPFSFDATFSPDSSQLLTSGIRDEPRLWNVKDGSSVKIAPWSRGRRRLSGGVRFTRDGKRLLVTSSVGQFVSPAAGELAQVLDAQTGKVLVSGMESYALSGSRSWISAFNSLDTLVALPGSEELPQVWSLETGKRVGGPLPLSSEVIQVRFSPDGRYLLTVTADNSVRVFDALASVPVTPLLKHESPVTTADFTPDGSHVLTASGRALRLWPLAPVSSRRVTLEKSSPGLSALSADGRRLLTCTLSAPGAARQTLTAQLRDAATGKEVAPTVEFTMWDLEPARKGPKSSSARTAGARCSTARAALRGSLLARGGLAALLRRPSRTSVCSGTQSAAGSCPWPCLRRAMA